MNFLVIGIAAVIIIVSVVFTPKSATHEPTSTPLASPEPTVNPTLNPTPGVGQFQYPGSTTDDVDKITDWYKEKIKSGGYNVKSFITTKTNGLTLNKLAATNGDNKIEVTISQKSQTSPVKISVTY